MKMKIKTRIKTWWAAALCGAVLLAFGQIASADSANQAAPDSPAIQGLGPTIAAEYGNNPVVQEKMKLISACISCHDETDKKHILSFFQTPHGALGDPKTPVCQSCHGESKKHLDGAQTPDARRPPPDRVFGTKPSTTAGYQPLPPQEQAEVCLSCHKAGLRLHWPGSQHQSNDVVCTNCHVNHAEVDAVRDRLQQPGVCFTCHKEKRAEFSKISHMPIENGKVICSDCHNPHGSPGPKLLVKNSVNETCFECHADKRGPFLWEHQPATEDCTNCHSPHGSNITPLLNDRPPFLCQSCHDGPHASPTNAGTSVTGLQGGGVAPGGNPSQNITGRACLNCHVQVHGSNSPAGAFLHR